MFNLFGKKKGTIDSIAIPDFAWEQVKNDSSIKQWINPESTMALSINFFGVVPDIPTMSDIDVLRAFYRTQLASNGAGILQVDLTALQGYAAIKTVFKFPKKGNGVTYLVSLTIPFSHCSYVIKIQAAEVEVTGIREAVIANRLLKKDVISVKDDGYENWAIDPYNPSLQGAHIMNQAEAVHHDQEFPKHPLSQARSTMDTIASKIQFKPDLQKLKGFRQ